MLPLILIRSHGQAGRLLLSRSRGPTFRYLISIGSEGDKLPAGFGKHDIPKLRLVFDDVTNDNPYLGRVAPKREDVARIIAFADKIEGEGEAAKTLIHCAAGVSRSGAAGCIVAARKLGPGKEGEALDYVRRLNGGISPNQRMMAHADELLGAEGRLLAETYKRWEHLDPNRFVKVFSDAELEEIERLVREEEGG